MDIKQKLDMLVEYERIDAPTNKKQRMAWRMYISEKIVNFLGARELTLMCNFPLESLNDRRLPNVYGMVAGKLG